MWDLPRAPSLPTVVRRLREAMSPHVQQESGADASQVRPAARPINEEASAELPHGRRQDAMTTNSTSLPIRLYFESDGNPVRYEVRASAPCNEALPPIRDVANGLCDAGLSPSRLADRLRAWAAKQGDVQRVTLSYTGRRFALGVLLASLTDARVTDIYLGLERACEDVAPADLLIYVLGPEQQESPLFTARDCATLFAAGSDMPQG